MKNYICVFALISAATYAKTQMGPSMPIANRKKMPVQNFFEDDKERFYRSWSTYLDVCWKGNRASFCENSQPTQNRQRLNFQCSQSLSANCPDPSCEVLEKKGIDDVTLLKGEHRDFLLIRGSLSGCGGVTYDIHVVDMQSQIRCSFIETVTESGMRADQDAEKVLNQIYKNPQKYLQWVGEKCAFRLAPSELAILKKKQ